MTLELDLLRSFLAVVDQGSISAAARRVLRTQAAVSLQMKRLEESVGAVLLERSGRGMRLTEAGERLAGYARRLMELADEAVMATGAPSAAGTMRLGVVQDIADSVLPDALARFARTHPAVRTEVVVERSTRLVDMVEAGDLDLAAAARLPRPGAMPIRREPMLWLAAAHAPVAQWAAGEIPLATFDAPCPFRSAAIDTLDRAGLRWRITYQSPSLSGIAAAVRAGLGVTVRTSLTAAGLTASSQLPALPSAEFALYRRDSAPSLAVSRFEEALIKAVSAPFPPGFDATLAIR